MTNSRTKNVSRNIVFGFVDKISVLLLPFITRTLLLYLMGTGSVGISSLFTSILSFLSLAELGFGQAVVYSMYKPVAENDTDTICALLKYYRGLYRIIGFTISIIGVLLLPALPYLIHGNAPENVNIYILYLIYLLNTVISYFFAGYKQSLLTAYQRTDIRHKIALLITIIVRVLEIIVIVLSKNLYLYASVSIFGTIITNIIVAHVTTKMYPNVICKGEVNNEQRTEIKKKLAGLFGNKLNSIVIHQADTLVISSFLGLTMLTQYGNYYFILNAVSGFIMIIFNSMTSSVGNKIALDSNEEVFKLYERLNFINNWLVGWCSICMLCLFQPFMIIWVKESLVLPPLMSILMALYFYVYQIQRTTFVFKDASGMWYEDRYRPYISMVINLVSNIVLVNIIGVYGVIISTIIAFLISLPWGNYLIFKLLFKRASLKNLFKMILDFIITFIIGAITYLICTIFSASIIGLVIRLIVCMIFPNVIYIIIYHKSEQFIYLRNLIIKIIKRKTV